VQWTSTIRNSIRKLISATATKGVNRMRSRRRSSTGMIRQLLTLNMDDLDFTTADELAMPDASTNGDTTDPTSVNFTIPEQQWAQVVEHEGGCEPDAISSAVC
jgi:hypothetical protein